MRKNNSALVLFVFLMFVSMILGMVYADNEEEDYYRGFLEEYERVLIEADYTTVYEGDSINFDIGYNEFSLNTIPFYVEFDKNVFELDLSNVKGVNGYIYKKYEVEENGNNIKYIFYYSKDKKTTWDKELIYGECCGDTSDAKNNKTVDMSVLTGLKLDIKSGISTSTYKVKSGYLDGDEVEFVPITIIKKENNSNTLRSLEIGNPTYASCNVKCKAVGVGSKFFYYSEGGYSSELIKIIFEDGTVEVVHDTNGYDYLNLDSDYNTIYQNDEVNLKVSKVFDSNTYYLEFDEETGSYLKYENGNYKVKPIYLMFEKDIYDVNINNIKFKDDLFLLKKYDEFENGNTVGYILYFELKEININVPIKENELFFELKLKTKTNTKIGPNYIKVGVQYDEIDYLIIDTSFLDNLYPINVISKNNISKKIESAKFYYGCFGLTGEELYVNVSKDSTTYGFAGISSDSIDYMNVICNQKCFVYENGSTYIEDSNSFDVKIKYDDGDVKKYSFVNTVKDREKFSILRHDAFINKVIIVGKGPEENYKKYFDEIKNFIELNKENTELYYNDYRYEYFNYDELSEYERELFIKVNMDFSRKEFPVIYMHIYKEKEKSDVIYGDINNDTLFTFISRLYDFSYVSGSDNGEIIPDDYVDGENNEDDYVDEENNKGNYENGVNFDTRSWNKVIMILLSVSIIIIILIIILLVLLIRNRKKLIVGGNNEK